MRELITFANEEFGNIRTIQIDDMPWFVGRDVAAALGYSNSRKAINDHIDDEDKGVTKCDTLSGQQNTTIINESGLYSLILSSKLPGAKRFKRWITSEVLPALRETGRYEMPQAVPAQRPLTVDDHLRAAAIIATCKSERLPYVIQLLVQVGIHIPLLTAKTQARDTTTARLINIACSEYGVTLRGLERATGVYATQLSRIRRGKSFPSPERAAIIRDALKRIVPEMGIEKTNKENE